MKPFYIRTAVLIVACVTGIASTASAENVKSHAGTAHEQLQAFYKNVQSMRAEFTQTLSSTGMSHQDVSHGVLRLQRPGKFRWDYRDPYEQQIVADGKNLWVYDIDLDQVIVKPLDFILGQTPAILLSGTADLAEKFVISEVPVNEVPVDNAPLDTVPVSEAPVAPVDKDLAWLKLVPKQDESGYQQLLLAFKNNDLHQMELVDSFGQATRLVFSHLERNPVIDASVFAFIPPPGVDVISDQN